MNFLIASHGKYAQGLKDVVSKITGKENIFVISAYEDETPLPKLFESVPLEQGEWIICTDILGGSVNQEIMNKYCNERIHVVAGVNVECLLQLITMDDYTNLDEMIREIVQTSQKRMILVNDLINQ